jgi:hypothetical protein
MKRKKEQRARPRTFEELLSASLDWTDPDEVDMATRAGGLFKKGLKLSYEYDFGSTTHLTLKVAGAREALIAAPNEVRVLARNLPPHIPCGICHKNEAAFIDMENAYDESSWFCERCAEEHELNTEERTLPVVNSPRTGVCGYTGD